MELANRGAIPEEYKRGGPHFGQLLDTMFEAQLEGRFEDEASGVAYIERLFSAEYKNALLFTGTLDRDGKNKLIEYAKQSGLEMEEVWAQGEDFIRKIVE